MENQELFEDVLNQQWEDAFSEMKIGQNPRYKEFLQYRDNDIYNNQQFNLTASQQSLSQNNSDEKIRSQQSVELQKEQMISQFPCQKVEEKIAQQQQEQQNALKLSRSVKNEKQQIYSKAYRSRLKQKYQNLEDQNSYLKKRIGELQNQLRQQELQLSRLKYSSDREFSAEDLRKTYLNSTNEILQQLNKLSKQQFESRYTNDLKFHNFLDDFWDQIGFAGKYKRKILDYHFNQILESVLRDSEKYLSLIYANSKKYDQLKPLLQFGVINSAYLEVYQPEGDLWHRLKKFNFFLHPIMLELNQHIAQFYKKYEDILSCSDKIHQFLKKMYASNSDIAIRRSQLQRWFDKYKYGKLMRRLKYTWFDWIKQMAKKQQENQPQKKEPKKKRALQ